MFYKELYLSPGMCWEIPTQAVDPGIPRKLQKIIRKILDPRNSWKAVACFWKSYRSSNP